MTDQTAPPPDDNYQPPNDENDTGNDDKNNDTTSTALAKIDQGGLASIAKSEAMAQVDVAHAYPRDLAIFLEKAVKIATMNQVTAKACLYTLKRKEWDKVQRKEVEKLIVGPSIRMAEIIAQTYQNLHSGARPIAIGDTTVTCQGVAWDLENNVRMTKEVSRRITGSRGKRYGDDMIVLTINATCSIAQRNAILSVVGRAYVNEVFDRVRYFAAGGKKPIEQKRQDVIMAFAKYGVQEDRILGTLGIKSVEQMTIEHIEALFGLGTRLKEGDSIDELFPLQATKEQVAVPGVEQQGQRVDLGKKPEPEPAAATVATVAQPVAAPAIDASRLPPTPAPKADPKKGGAAQISFGADDNDRAAAAPTDAEMAKLKEQIS